MSIPIPKGILGNHRIKLIADPNNLIQEFGGQEGEQNNRLLNPTNNEEGISFFILENQTKVAFPPNYDVEPIGEDFVIDGIRRARIIFDIPAILPRGNFISNNIGPASSWEQFEWKANFKDTSDELSLSIYGITEEGAESLLFENIQDKPLDISSIDATSYPYLKIGVAMVDSLNRTTPFLEQLQLSFKRSPDIRYALDEFKSDTLNQGEELSLKMKARNFGGGQSDTLDLSLQIKDALNRQFIQNNIVEPLEGQTEKDIAFNFNTQEMSAGQASLAISSAIKKAQLNQLISARNFFVKSDQVPPQLEVTFDGRRILNKELISPEPFIRIELSDDNNFVLLDDSSSLQVTLIDPLQTERRLSVNDGDVLFTAASNLDDNVALMEFTPQLSIDGTYKLIVNGNDKSGNKAGALNYEIEFEVINANQLSNLLPYPNPFSTQTRFVYTLTGSTPPSHFLLRIMTPSGRVVREIDQDEFGELKVGTHQSDFIWDGTDNFGDELANGVYLYKMIVKDQNLQDFELFQSENRDQFFDKGFGKIVILR